MVKRLHGGKATENAGFPRKAATIPAQPAISKHRAADRLSRRRRDGAGGRPYPQPLREDSAMRRRDFSLALGTVCLGLLFLPGGEILAADLSVRAPVSAVTVFPDRAEVTRTIQATVPAGATTLVLEGLPATLLPDSVRVGGISGGDIAIGSVETRPVYEQAAVNAEERRLVAEIEALGDRRRALQDQVAALQVQAEFIAAIGREMPTAANEEIVRGSMDPVKWQEAWKALSAGTAEARDGMRLAEIEMRGIDAEIGEKQAELAQIQTGQRATTVARVNIGAAAGADVKLEISYQLPDAWWWPVYDARLSTESGRIDLVQMAQVQQRTGEDWSNVKLTLSTTRPSAGAALPDLQTWFLLSAEQFQARGGGVGQNSLDDLMSREEAAAPATVPLESDGRRDAAILRAGIVATEFAAQYEIPGMASVPADDSAHKFVIADHAMTGKLAVRAVPKIAAVAHLFATFTYDGTDPLLPGSVSLFRDGAFVGTSSMALLRPQEERALGFGIDDKVHVDYWLEDGEQSTEGVFSSDRRIERRYRIEIDNYHSRPIEITVLDQLPVPQEERIEVEMLRDTTKPTATDWEDRKGVLAWTATYQPDEQKVVKFGYAVTYPEDMAVPAL
jgi:uncharacterized protein (TIGR02231 family)